MKKIKVLVLSIEEFEVDESEDDYGIEEQIGYRLIDKEDASDILNGEIDFDYIAKTFGILS